jgi:hypothetical protein
MEDHTKLIVYLTVWMIAAGAVFLRQLGKNSAGAGLSLAYLLNLWILHWVASTLYVLPGYSYYDPVDVIAGLEQSVYAVVTFSVSYLIFSQILTRAPKNRRPSAISDLIIATRAPGESAQSDISRGPSTQQTTKNQSHLAGEAPHVSHVHVSDTKLTNIYIWTGVTCYALSMTGLGALPTVTALITGASNLAVVGLMLKSWLAWRRGNRKSFRLWLALASAYPLLTIITQGFIGFGIFNTILVFTFVAGFYRPRWKLVVLGLAAGYLGLSMFVTYMRDRGDIRNSVWGGESYGSRLDQLKATFSQAELFSINEDEHLERIDLRLNQNSLVGASVRYLESGRVQFARGETLWQALTAFVPRIIWPDKPVTAGSGDLVSKYTGYYFQEGTSVGVGQVMEFYINFGQAGVIIGFLAIGFIIALIDKRAEECFAKNDWINFACWYLPGAAIMQVGGSLVEVTASAGASLAVSTLVKYLVLRGLQVSGRKQASLRVKLGSQSKSIID